MKILGREFGRGIPEGEAEEAASFGRREFVTLAKEKISDFLAANREIIKSLSASAFSKFRESLSLSLGGLMFFTAVDEGLGAEADPYGILAELEAMRKNSPAETSAPSDLAPKELKAVERMPKGPSPPSGGVSGFRPLGEADYARLRADRKFTNAITGEENIGDIGGDK